MKKISTWLTCGALILSNFSGGLAYAATSEKQIFTDVPTTHWAYQTIQALATDGLWQGVGHQQFAPDRPMTHQEYATLLQRIFSKTVELPEGFQASRCLTRMEMAQWLYETLNSSGTSLRAVKTDDFKFADEKQFTPEQAKIAQALAATRLMVGDDQQRFNPKQFATRAEIAVLSRRVVKFRADYEANQGIFYTTSNQGDQLLIRLYWGEKPTWGYSIEVKDTQRSGDKLYVYYATSSPAPGTLVGQMVTYPQTEVLIPDASTQTIGEIILKPAT